MNVLLKSLVEWLKLVAYIAVTVSAGYTYLNKDALLSKLGSELKPYVEEQVSISVKEEVPIALKEALQQDNMHISIDSSQMRMFSMMLNENKQEILEGATKISEKMAKLVLNDFLVVEREITDPVDGQKYYIKGILIGKDDLGRDSWIFTIKEKLN